MLEVFFYKDTVFTCDVLEKRRGRKEMHGWRNESSNARHPLALFAHHESPFTEKKKKERCCFSFAWRERERTLISWD